MEPNFSSLGPVVWHRGFLEPRVLQSLFGRDSFGRIIDEDLLEEIEEVAAELIIFRDDILCKC